ncbi:MAG: dienelactone hydrolase family protein [Candidatus Obscuribacterales bacterium]|nr:dienelactone hydrolase family protein [Candidatus Obscuribacterales bacterium]
MAGTTVEIKTQTGTGFTGYLALPEAKRAPGILLIQEIFGVNSHIKEVADLYAEAGYVVLAPDVFWRAQKNVELGYTPDDIQKGMGYWGKCDKEQVVKDLKDALNTLRSNPQCSSKVAATGYCLGGYLSYRLATADVVDAAVCYYGGMIQQSLDLASNLHCPIMMHFGEKDTHIPLSAVDQIRTALKDKGHVEIFVYKGADHGFNCDQRASYDRRSAMLAYGRSQVMLNRALT